MSPQQLPTRSPSRRTVLRSAAWSVPVLTVAAAAPAHASSPPPEQPYFEVSPGGTSVHEVGTPEMSFWSLELQNVTITPRGGDVPFAAPLQVLFEWAPDAGMSEAYFAPVTTESWRSDQISPYGQRATWFYSGSYPVADGATLEVPDAAAVTPIESTAVARGVIRMTVLGGGHDWLPWAMEWTVQPVE